MIWQVLIHWPLPDIGAVIFSGFFILVFLSVGFLILLSPLRAAARARRTYYAITDQRVLIISKFRRRSVASYAPCSINFLEVTERASGFGDIVFRRNVFARGSPPDTESGWGENDEGTPKIYEVGRTTIGFFGIPEVRRVEKAMRRLVPEIE